MLIDVRIIVEVDSIDVKKVFEGVIIGVDGIDVVMEISV